MIREATGLIFHTKVDLAEHFNTSLTTIDKHTRNPLCPGGRDGPWDRDEFTAFLVSLGSPVTEGKSSTASRPMQMAAAAKALLVVEQHRKLKLQNDITSGQLVDAAEVSQRWNRGLLRIKHRLEAAPKEMEMRFPESTRPENLADFEEFVNQLLLEMSEMEPLRD